MFKKPVASTNSRRPISKSENEITCSCVDNQLGGQPDSESTQWLIPLVIKNLNVLMQFPPLTVFNLAKDIFGETA